MKKTTLSIAVASSLFLGGCAVSQNIGKIAGTTIGAAGGAAVGKKIGGEKGMYAGLIIGGVLGYFIGDEIDARRNAIKEITQKSQDTEVAFEDIDDTEGNTVGQSYILHSEKSQFNSGSSTLNSEFEAMFKDIAMQYKDSKQKIMIVGHTDADGSDIYNQELSENRAKEIAKLFKKYGVNEDNIYYRGMGETNPLVQNDSAKNKAKNRRVEVVEIPTEEALAQYAYNQPINTALYTKQKPAAKPQKTTPQQKPATATQTVAQMANQQPKSFGAGELNLGLSGVKTAQPIGAQSKPKFDSIDKDGDAKKTAVKGEYQVADKESSNSLGSCQNTYAYGKKSYFEIKGQEVKDDSNLLFAQVGEPVQESVFSLTTPAVADDQMLAYYGSCLTDSVKKSGSVKKLATGEEVLAYSNDELAPLLNGTAFYAQVDNEFLMVNPIGVKRSNMQSVSCPEISLIKKGANQPWYGTTAKTVTYNGQRGILYRVYPADKSKLECMDISFPHGNPQNAKAVIYFHKNGKMEHKEIELKTTQNNRI